MHSVLEQQCCQWEAHGKWMRPWIDEERDIDGDLVALGLTRKAALISLYLFSLSFSLTISSGLQKIQLRDFREITLHMRRTLFFLFLKNTKCFMHSRISGCKHHDCLKMSSVRLSLYNLPLKKERKKKSQWSCLVDPCRIWVHMQSFNTDLPGSLQPSPQPGSQCPTMPTGDNG